MVHSVGRVACRVAATGFLVAGFLLAGWTSAQAPDAGGSWAAGAEMPTARSEMRAATLDGRLYVPGGLGPNRTLSAFEAYDPVEDAWHEFPSLPEPVHHAGVAAAAGRVFVTGGYRTLTFRTDHAGFWAYDPSDRSWTRMPNMPAPRAGHALVAIDEMLYVVGGVGPGSRELWRFDAAQGRWLEPGASLPTPREHLAAVAFEGRIYAIAGRWRGRGNLGTVEVYDPEADRWSEAPDLPTPRSGLTAGATGGRIHVVGGESLDDGRTFVEHEVYDPEASSWRAATSLEPGRHGLASATVAGRWYVVGGATRAGGGTLDSLTADVDVWAPDE